MKKRIVGYLVLFLTAYCFFLLWFMPASYVIQRLEVLTPAGVVVEASGTQGLWHRGQAAFLVVDNRRVSELDWRFRPFFLLTGRITVDVQFVAQDERFDLRLSRTLSDSIVSNINGRYPVSVINTFLAPAEALPVRGEIELAVESIKISRNQLSGGVGEIVWHQAESTFMPGVILDGLRLSFEDAHGSSEGVKGTLVDLGGPLLVDLQFTLSPDGRYQCTGTVGVREKGNRQVLEALKVLGRPDRNGMIQINQSGTL